MTANEPPASIVFLFLQGSTKNVSKRCSRIGRSVLGNGFLFLGNFTRLDRELQLAPSPFDSGDENVDLVTDRITIRALFRSITAEIGASNKGFCALVIHADSTVLD